MQKALTNNPEPLQAADAKKFLALTALDENPKALTAAEGEVQKELKSNPEYVPALMAQAALLAQRGEAKAATETYSNILRRLPDFAPAQKRLAALYGHEGTQDIARRPRSFSASWTIELRKEGVSARDSVVPGERPETAARR
jgi:tetratricopeptide (TPR) repeat protein